jgi:hypothetical protein
MKLLESLLTPEKTIACPECGGFVFFDWGLKFLHIEPGLGPRTEGWQSQGGVVICAGCHHPVVWAGGDYYDAATYIPKDTIEKLIREGQARSHAVPVRAMDP